MCRDFFFNSLEYVRSLFWKAQIFSVNWIKSTSLHYLGDWADEILIITPYFLIFLYHTTSSTIPKLLGYYASALAIYFVLWLGYVSYLEGASVLMQVFLIFSVYATFSLVFEDSRPEYRYLFEGVGQTSKGDAEHNMNIKPEALIALFLIYVYWYQIVVPTADFYVAFLAVAISIQGFVGLIYTLSVEKISLPSIKKKVFSDTRFIFYCSVVLALLSIIGMTFFGLKDLNHGKIEEAFRMRINEDDLYKSSAAGWLMATVTAVIILTVRMYQIFIAIDWAIELGNKTKDRKVVYFDETDIDPKHSYMSTGDNGFSKIRKHLKNIGMSCLHISELDERILNLKEATIIMRRKKGEIKPENMMVYHSFVKFGGVLLVLVDAQDVSENSIFLRQLGLDLKVARSEEGEDNNIRISNFKGLNVESIHEEYAIFSDPVFIKPNEHWEVVVPAPTQASEEDKALIVSRTIGKGLVVCIGTVSFWQNIDFDKGINKDLLDALLTFAEKRVSLIV